MSWLRKRKPNLSGISVGVVLTLLVELAGVLPSYRVIMSPTSLVNTGEEVLYTRFRLYNDSSFNIYQVRVNCLISEISAAGINGFINNYYPNDPIHVITSGEVGHFYCGGSRPGVRLGAGRGPSSAEGSIEVEGLTLKKADLTFYVQFCVLPYGLLCGSIPLVTRNSAHRFVTQRDKNERFHWEQQPVSYGREPGEVPNPEGWFRSFRS